MFEKALILGLYSVTPVHAGSGAELSVIDLPIQRERHTGFPVIWGQSLKGVLRSYFRRLELGEKVEDNKTLKEKLEEDLKELERRIKETNNEEQRKELERKKSEIINKLQSPPKTEVIFGPSTERAHEHAGAVSVGDAKILLFPVRSLKGVFAYVTCPIVLERFKRDLKLVGMNNEFTVPSLNPEEAVVSENTALEVNEKIIVEDLALTAKKQNISEIVKAILKISPVSIDENRIAIVHDDVFSMIVRITTEIVARVRISAETGTVETGALWYEEYLPSDALMYSVIAIAEPRRKVNGLSSANDIAEEFKRFNGRFVQVGGNETIGKGFVKLKVIGDENA